MAKEIPVDILKAYNEGESVLSIARRLGAGTNRVANFIRSHGLLRSPTDAKRLGWSKMSNEQRESRRPKHTGKQLDPEKILAMHRDGMTPSHIGATLHIGARRIKALLIENGVLTVREAGKCLLCNAEFDGHGSSKFCLECAPDERWNKVAGIYGISKNQYDLMTVTQDGHCALCTRGISVIDHCHKTGVVRGLLCNGCNFAMSRVDEDVEWTTRARIYKERSAIA